jgi:radical SAM superfamily enzyme YgiQ (UPF0313 family)
MKNMRVILISTYELGRQPFGLASPAAWLARAGAEVQCFDLAVQQLSEQAVAEAGLVAFYLPMHTATRLAAPLLERARRLNPGAHLCCYGLYAPVNERFLRRLGAQTILGGEFEQGLEALYRRLEAGSREGAQAQRIEPDASASQPEPRISLARQRFLAPERGGLPPLNAYAFVRLPGGERLTTGYTEASRGCKHTCRHCPVVPVYGGRFRVVQREVVLEDITRQVAVGAQHITFGDPDFFNGPGHAIPLVRALHERFPALSYDVTIKVEHLLLHRDLLPALRDTGCLWVTSAVEAVDDAILARFDKRHTRADFVQAAGLLRAAGLALNPTFVTFTPWTTTEGYLDLLRLLAELGLVEHVAPIQYAIRLLIPAGSRLLELPETEALVAPFDEAALCYPWAHPDPALDQLYEQVRRAVQAGLARGESRRAIFGRVWELARRACGVEGRQEEWRALPRALIPHMSEPWYC